MIHKLNCLTLYIPWTSILPDPINSPPTFHLNVTSSSHNSVYCQKLLKLFLRQNFGVSLNFLQLIRNNILRNISSVPTYCSRASFQVGVHPSSYFLASTTQQSTSGYRDLFHPTCHTPLHGASIHLHYYFYLIYDTLIPPPLTLACPSRPP